MKTLLVLLSSLLFILLSSTSCESKKDCPDDLICTMIYVAISVDIADSEGNAVELSKARVSSPFLENSIDPLEDPMPQGSYVVLSDSHMKYLDNRTARPFLFEGWINDTLVVSQEFMIRHDCCHVVRESGPEEIVID